MDLRHYHEKFAKRLAEVESALSDPAVFDHKARAQELSREYSRLKELVATVAAYAKTSADLEANRALLQSEPAGSELAALAREEVARLEVETQRLALEAQRGVVPPDPAVQILHKPTGLIVRCADQRSQQKNKARALTVLRSRLLDLKVAEEKAKYDHQRKSQVGTGERSEKIRTYNFPQNRVTDHRIELTLYNLQSFLAGEMDAMIEPLMAHELEEKLKAVKL